MLTCDVPEDNRYKNDEADEPEFGNETGIGTHGEDIGRGQALPYPPWDFCIWPIEYRVCGGGTLTIGFDDIA